MIHACEWTSRLHVDEKCKHFQGETFSDCFKFMTQNSARARFLQLLKTVHWRQPTNNRRSHNRLPKKGESARDLHLMKSRLFCLGFKICIFLPPQPNFHSQTVLDSFMKSTSIVTFTPPTPTWVAAAEKIAFSKIAHITLNSSHHKKGCDLIKLTFIAQQQKNNKIFMNEKIKNHSAVW